MRGRPAGPLSENLTLRQRMECTLMTERGRALYKKRGQTVEPVLGQIKAGRGIWHFICGKGLRLVHRNGHWFAQRTIF